MFESTGSTFNGTNNTGHGAAIDMAGSPSNLAIQRTFSALEPNQTYVLTFRASSGGGDGTAGVDDNALGVTINGTSTAIAAADIVTSFRTFTIPFTTDASGQAVIRIEGVDPTPDNTGALLDTVSVARIDAGTLASVAENAANGAVVGSVTGVDPDAGDTLTYSLTDNAGGRFAINATTGQITVADGSKLDFESATAHTVGVRVTDAAGLSIDKNVVIAVGNVNEGPIITSGATATFAENGAGTVYTATSTDPEGAARTYSLSGTDAALFTIDATTGAVSFKSAPNFEAPADGGGNNVYDVVVNASDGVNTTSQAVAISVTNVNEGPVITSGSAASFAENGTGAVYTATSTDPEGAARTYSLSGTDASLFTIDATTGAVSFKSAPNFESPTDNGGNNVYDVVVNASDGVNTTSQAVAISVTNVDEAASFVSPGAVGVPENSTGTVYTAAATDPDAGTKLIYTISGADASLFQIDSETGAVSFKAKPDFENPADAGADNVHNFVVHASEATGPNLLINGSFEMDEILSGSWTAQDTLTGWTGIGADSIELWNNHSAVAASDGSQLVEMDSAGGWDGFYQDVTTTAGQTYVLSLDSAVRPTASAATCQFEVVWNGTVIATIQPGSSWSESSFLVTGTGGDDRLMLRETSGSSADSYGAIVDNLRLFAVTSTSQSVSQDVAITVTNVNEAPILSSASSVAVAENAVGTVYTATATDPDAGTVLTYSLSGTDAARFNIDTTTGAVSFKASPNFEAPADSGANNIYNVVVSASDGVNTTGQAVAISVTNVNEGPVITSDAAASFAENGSGTVYTATSTDPEGAARTYSLSGTDAALFNINATTGAVTFKSSPNFEAPTDAGGNNVYDVVVNASDGVNTTSQAVAISVTDVNEGPVITSGSAVSVAENVSGTVYTATSTDQEGTARTYSLSGTDAALFDIDATTGAVSFKASPNFEAPTDAGGNNVYDVVVNASDGVNTTSQAVAISVTDVNEGPVITSGSTASIAEDGTGTVYTVTSTDPEGAARTYSLSGTDAALFDIDATTGAVSFKASPNFEAPTDSGGNNVYDVVVNASDGVNTTSQAVAISVTNTNEGPVITSGSMASFAENGSGTVYTATSTDPEGVARTYSLSGTDAARFNIDATTGAVSFKASPNFEAPTDSGSNNVYDVVVNASDGVNTTSQAVAISVTNVNEGPVITSGSTASIAENSTGTVYAAISVDPEGAARTYSLSGTDAALFNIDASTGAVSFKASPNFEAPADAGGNNVYDVVVNASDGVNTTSQSVAISVTDVDEGPVITSGSTASFAENGTGTVYTATATDPEGVARTYSLSGTDAALFNIDAVTGAVSFKSAPNFEAPTDAGGNNVYDVVVNASDGVNTASQAVAISVTDVNEGPVITSGSTASIAENGTGTVYTATSTDSEGVARTYSLSGTDAALFDIDATTGAVSFKASPNFEAPADSGGNNVYDVVVNASDGVNTTTQAVAISVTNVNEGPVITSGSTAAFAENGTGTAYTVTSTDPEGTARTYTLSGTDAALFNIDAVTGAVTFKSAPDFEAPTDSGGNNVYDVVVNASDGVNTASQAVAISVTNVSGNFTDTGGQTVITGSSEEDTVQATSDTSKAVSGGTGSDSIVTGAGNDTVVGGAGADTMAGGDGADTLDYSASAGGVSINLADGSASGGDAQGDNFAGFENIQGSSTASNSLVGDGGANQISGGANTDLLDGGGGNDTLAGGGGADTLSGGDGDDRLVGGAAADQLTGGDGNDTFVFAAGDIVAGEVIDGGTGNDTVLFTGTNDVQAATVSSIEAMAFEAGATVTLAASQIGSGFSDTLAVTGAGGTQALAINLASSGSVDLSGFTFTNWTAGTDTITVTGSTGNDTIQGSSQNDVLVGGTGTNTLSYADATSGITASLAITTAQVTGGAGTDTLSGFENMTGSSFNDTLAGNNLANALVGGSGNDTLTGGALGDTIDGGEGTDTANYSTSGAAVTVNLTVSGAQVSTGDASGDVLSGIENVTGSTLADTLTGDGGQNRLDGGNGDDLLQGGGGADSLIGGTGNDTASYAGSSAAVQVDLANTGAQVSTGDADGDILSGIEALIGSAFNDALTGDGAANTIAGGQGADTLSGGAGSDTLDYRTSTAGVSINLTTNTASGGDAQGDVISGFENVFGSNTGGDVLSGDGAGSILRGYGGTDTINAGAGNDTIDGGTGADRLYGEDGNDTFTFVANDAAGGEIIDGGAGTDTLSVGGTNTFSSSTIVSVEAVTFTAASTATFSGSQYGAGLASGMRVTGSAGADVLAFSMTANASIDLSGVQFTSWTAGSDSTRITGSTGVETIKGTSQNDSIAGGSGNDEIDAREGNDTVEGGAGADKLDGGAGNDQLSYAGSAAGVSINLDTNAASGGDAEGDTISHFENVTGSGSADTLIGDANANALSGGGGADTIDGAAGNDWIVGGAGADSLTGGDGNDVFAFSAGELVAGEVVAGGAGTDTLSVSGTNDFRTGTLSSIEGLTYTAAATATFASTQIGSSLSSAMAVTGSGAANAIVVAVANGGSVDLSGFTFTSWTAGSDTITITGGTADETIEGSRVNDVLTGGSGTDTLSYAHATSAVTVNLATTTAQVTGGAGTDTISGFENLTGSGFNDTLTGSTSANALSGGDGNDRLSGGGGNDTIDGGIGSDTAVFTGNWRDYTITTGTDANGTFYQLVDNRTGSPDGTEKVYAVENFQFADGTVAVSTAADLLNEGPTGATWQSGGNVNENSAAGTAVGTVVATDPDTLDRFTYALTDNAGGRFAINASTGQITVASGAALNFEAATSHSVSVQVTDAAGQTAVQTLTINVANVNEGPIITSGSAASFAENGTGTVYTATSTDPEGTARTYSLSGTDATLFNIDAATGAVTFKAAPNFEAPTDTGGNNVYNVVVNASDGVNTTTQAVAISVTNVNEGPVITSSSAASVAENSTGTVYTATATDPEGTARTYSLSGTDAALFNINATTGAVSFKAAPNFEAPTDAGGNNVYDVVVNASDGVNTATQAVAISVTNANEGPVITSGSTASVAENSTGTVYTATSTDPEGAARTYSLSGTDAARFNIDATTGAVSFKASPNFEAPTDSGGNNVYDVVVNASDGVNTTTQAVAISVTNVSGTFTDTGGQTVFTGTSEEDTVQATSATSKSVSGGTGNDSIVTGAGNDTVAGGAGADTMAGGGGTDTLDYSTSAVGVSINLTAGSASGGDAQGDNISGFENVLGSSAADRLTGDGNANALSGGAGNDSLVGGAGNDTKGRCH